MLNPDFRDMLSALSDAGAEYLLVGAYALAVHGLPRATGDLDIWIRATPDNAERVWAALAEFGAPLEQVGREDLSRSDTVFQIGVVPRRIDVLTSVDGVEFDAAWAARVEVEIDGINVPVISRTDLAANKRASGRRQDLADLEWLERRED